MRRILIFGILLFLNHSNLDAGGWTQPKGFYFLQASYGRFSTMSEFNLNGDDSRLFVNFPTLLDGKFSSQSLFLYGEYGLENGLTLVVSSSFQSFNQTYLDIQTDSRSGRPTDTLSRALSASGLGDTRIYGRFLLAEPSFGVFSIQAGVKLPTGNNSSAIPFGTGEVDFEAVGQFGLAFPFFNQLYGYATAELGYRFRGGEAFNDELFFSVSAGIPVANPLTLKVGYFGLISQGDVLAVPQGSNILNNYNLQRFQFGLNFAVHEQFGFGIDAFKDVSGKNVAKGTTILMSVYFRT